MRCSPFAATAPLIPEPIMLMGTWPGARTANTACMTFAIAEIGAQLVSPSTRMPTSMRTMERTIDTAESQSGKPSEIFCTTASTTAQASEPQITQRMGKSPPASTSLPRSPRNVLAMTRHLSASAARPPDTMRPVAGHITQRCRTRLKDSSGTSPRAKSGSGRITQPITMPSPIDNVTRKPMRRPAPRESTPTSEPSRRAAACGPRKTGEIVSGIQPKACRATVSPAESRPPNPSAATLGPASLGP